MGATGTQLGRTAPAEAEIVAAAREFLSELGATRGIEELAARGASAHLERELGLGSLERVELALRLGHACGVRLPDQSIAEAVTLKDLTGALLRAIREGTHEIAAAETLWAAEPGSQRAQAYSADVARQIESAATLTEILRLRGIAEPARAHIHLYEGGDEPRTITFEELFERASAISAELRRRGLEPGQTVAIMLPTCAEFFFTFAGILLAGGVPVPIYPPFRVDRIAEYASRQANILSNAECQFLLSLRQAESLARLLKPRVPSLREVLDAGRLASVTRERHAPGGEWRPVENLPHRARSEDIAFLQYTSGSTGEPKGVVLTHANLLANIRAIVQEIALRPDDVAVSWLPLYHDMGLIGAWFVPLYTGIPVVVMSPLAFLSRPERWLRAIHLHRGTISPAPNFAFELCVRKIADTDLQGLDLSCWRAALNGAEPVRAETLERFAARFGPYGFRREALVPVYGLAEATLGVSARGMETGWKVDRIEREAFEAEGRAVVAMVSDSSALEFVSAGRPLPGVEIRVIASDGADAGERREGRLWFRGPSATSGYYRNPAATRELVREDGWLDSGDLAYVAEGELYITGRAKDVIIKAGRNLYPQEIESAAGGVRGVRAGCVVAFGAPDERSGTERLVVVAEVRDRTEEKRIAEEITRAVDDAVGLPPDRVELLAPQSIPKTSSGKLRRSETRRLYLEGRLGKPPAPVWLQVAQLASRSAIPRVLQFVARGAKRAAEVLYGVYALAVFMLLFVPLWLVVLAMRDEKLAAWLVRSAARVILFAAVVPVRMEGSEIPRGKQEHESRIYGPNHSSYVDILVCLAVLPSGVRFVAKGEVLDMLFFRTIVRRSGQFAFDRSDPQARVRQAEKVTAALQRGESVAIYPEGTFTPAAGIRPFQLGAFKAAVDSQRPICPVAIRGARQILRDGTYLPRPGRVTVTFGPLVLPERAADGDWREVIRLRDATRDIIARNSGEPLL